MIDIAVGKPLWNTIVTVRQARLCHQNPEWQSGRNARKRLHACSAPHTQPPRGMCSRRLVGWSVTCLCSTNMAISETKGQGWRVILLPIEGRPAIY